MAPHSSTLPWKIPWTEEPGRLQSMGSHRVGHDGSTLAAAAAALHNIEVGHFFINSMNIFYSPTHFYTLCIYKMSSLI